jgi:glycosyltransferase involved in cell wall biosynthesis
VKESKTLIVPIYNEIGAIDQMLERIKQFSIEHSDWDVLVVNDGSDDGTQDRLQEFNSSKIKVIHHDVNRGYGAALKTGIKSIDSDLVGIIDADGTYPFEAFHELEEYCSKYTMVVGARTKKGAVIPMIKRFPKFFIRNFASYVTGEKIPDFNSGMRIFRRDLALKLINYLPDGFSFTTTITVASSANNIPIKYVPIDYMERIGKSKIRPIKDTLNFLLLISKLGIYYQPFKIYGPLVLASGLLGVGFTVYRSIYGEGFLVVTIVSFLLSIIFLCFSMLAHAISVIFRDRLND